MLFRVEVLERNRELVSGGSTNASFKLKGIDGAVPPGVDFAV